jgi:hypothetical protein
MVGAERAGLPYTDADYTKQVHMCLRSGISLDRWLDAAAGHDDVLRSHLRMIWRVREGRDPLPDEPGS